MITECREKRIENKRGTHPFLSIGVGQVVDSLRVPHLSDTEQVHRQEAVFSHDHEVHEESGGGLDHSDLPVGHRNQPVNTHPMCQIMPWRYFESSSNVFEIAI